MATDSSSRNNSPSNFKDAGQGNPSPPAKVVDDFHRNSDVDHRKESQHHTIGTSRYNAAAGDHVHDGSSGVALLDGTAFSGNVVDVDDQAQLLKDIITALTNLGAVDNTTQTGNPIKYYREMRNTTWPGGSQNTSTEIFSFPAGLFSGAPNVQVSRLTGSYTGPCETRMTSSPTASGVNVQVRTTDAATPPAGTSTWISLLAVGV
jgi:hypothetical protein